MSSPRASAASTRLEIGVERDVRGRGVGGLDAGPRRRTGSGGSRDGSNRARPKTGGARRGSWANEQDPPRYTPPPGRARTRPPPGGGGLPHTGDGGLWRLARTQRDSRSAAPVRAAVPSVVRLTGWSCLLPYVRLPASRWLPPSCCAPSRPPPRRAPPTAPAPMRRVARRARERRPCVCLTRAGALPCAPHRAARRRRAQALRGPEGRLDRALRHLHPHAVREQDVVADEPAPATRAAATRWVRTWRGSDPGIDAARRSSQAWLASPSTGRTCSTRASATPASANRVVTLADAGQVELWVQHFGSRC